VALSIAAAVFIRSDVNTNMKIAGAAVIVLAIGFLIEITVPSGKKGEAHENINYLKSISKFQDIVENAPDPIVVLDKMGFLTYMNRAAEEISGYSRKELVGKHFAQMKMLPPASLAKAAREFSKTMMGEPGPPHHLDFTRKDGSVFTVDANHQPISKDGKLIGVEVIFRYFGEKKK